MFEKITQKLTQSVCSNDGESLANLFADNGVYHDYIYGSFKGKKNIKLMLNNYFHRDAKNFFWEILMQKGTGVMQEIIVMQCGKYFSKKIQRIML